MLGQSDNLGPKMALCVSHHNKETEKEREKKIEEGKKWNVTDVLF